MYHIHHHKQTNNFCHFFETLLVSTHILASHSLVFVGSKVFGVTHSVTVHVDAVKHTTPKLPKLLHAPDLTTTIIKKTRQKIIKYTQSDTSVVKT